MNYDQMSIDDLFAWRDQWPAQRTEWNRAELALQKRRAVRDAYLDLAEELRDEGILLVPESNLYGTFLSGMRDFATLDRALSAAPIQGEAQ